MEEERKKEREKQNYNVVQEMGEMGTDSGGTGFIHGGQTPLEIKSQYSHH